MSTLGSLTFASRGANREAVRSLTHLLRATFLLIVALTTSTATCLSQSQLYQGYFPFTPVTISLQVKGLDVQKYETVAGTTEVLSKPVIARFGNRDILQLLASADLLLGKDGRPTRDIRGWAFVAGVGYNQTPWPKLEGIGCYAVNTNIVSIQQWNGSDLYVPGLSLFGGLNGTDAQPTLAKIQINGNAPFTAMNLRAEVGEQTTVVKGQASFEGPVDIEIKLPDEQAPTDPEKVRSINLQGHISGGFKGFNWHPDKQGKEPLQNTLPLLQTRVSGLSGVLLNSPEDGSNISVPMILTGSITLGPTRLIPYIYER